MWPSGFEQRLAAWSRLREETRDLPLSDALNTINTWWFQTPWRAYHLHWDDRSDWPDPWQLLSDNIYCDLARGLGIMYTIAMLDRPDLQDSVLFEANQGNLVQAGKEKYILNWDEAVGVNNNLDYKNSKHIVYQSDIKQQLY